MYKLLMFLVLFSIGCATLKDLDFPVCVELAPDRSFCTYTISDKDFVWDSANKFEGKDYWSARPSMILLPVSSWVQLKKTAIKLCHQDEKRCQKEFGSWDRKINKIDKRLQK